MRVTVTAPFIELGKGTILAGLNAEQLSRRRLCLNDLGDGRQEITNPTHFKQGETFEMEEIPKNLREFLAVAEDQPLPDLDDMTRAELVELAESRGVRVPANATKPDVIAAIQVGASEPSAVHEKPMGSPVEDLDLLTREQLVGVAESLGVPVTGRDNKHDIVKAIRKQQKKAA